MRAMPHRSAAAAEARRVQQRGPNEIAAELTEESADEA